MHSRHPLRLTLIAAAAAIAMSPARAQQTKPAAGAAAATLDQVEVRGTASGYDARRDDTASKIVINHEEIVKYGDTSIVDVLKRLPGVTARGADVRLRGLGNGFTQILINGERAPAGFTLDALAPELIERIEVLRAASAEFSTQSIAGTINLVLKKAIGKGQRELKIGAGMAKGLFAPGASLQLADRKGPLSYALALNALMSDAETEASYVDQRFNPAGGRTVLVNSASATESHFRQLQLAPRLNLMLPGGDTLTSQSLLALTRHKGAMATRSDYALGPASIFPDLDASTSNRGETARSDLNWVHKFGAGARLDAKIGAAWFSNANDSIQLGFTPSGVNSLKRLVATKAEELGYSSTGKYTTPVFAGHVLAAGWDGGRSERDETRDSAFGGTPAIAPYPALPSGRPAIPATPVTQGFVASVRRIALFAQDEWNVTPRWSVYLGARWEGIDTRSSGTGAAAFAPFDSRTSVWSPVFQTLYKLPGTKADQLRLAVTRTYKAPAAARLIPRRVVTAANSEFEPDTLGNPALRPELASGVDASFEHYWAEGALLSVSASVRRIDDYNRVALTRGADLRWFAQPVNAGRANTRGLELEAKFPLKAVLCTAPAIDLRASVSRNWSSVESVPGPDNRLDQQTPLSATLGADYKGAVLSGGGSLVYRQGGPMRNSVEERSDSNDRRDLDLYVLWKLSKASQLRVTASSLLVVDAIADNSYTDARGLALRSTVNPGLMQVRAVLETKF
ncbi:MAG: TonB-dependent receptor [Pseudomonadota bacterium]